MNQLKVIGKVATNIWPVITSLTGVLIGGYVANRNQRKHWIADNERAEYRELLTTMSRTFNTIIVLVGPGVPLSEEEQRKVIEAESELSVVVHDRIFIAASIHKMNVLMRWHEAHQAYRRTYDVGQFSTSFGRIVSDLLKSANEIMK
jgi:hypothetical protein